MVSFFVCNPEIKLSPALYRHLPAVWCCDTQKGMFFLDQINKKVLTNCQPIKGILGNNKKQG